MLCWIKSTKQLSIEIKWAINFAITNDRLVHCKLILNEWRCATLRNEYHWIESRKTGWWNYIHLTSFLCDLGWRVQPWRAEEFTERIAQNADRQRRENQQRPQLWRWRNHPDFKHVRPNANRLGETANRHSKYQFFYSNSNLSSIYIKQSSFNINNRFLEDFC